MRSLLLLLLLVVVCVVSQPGGPGGNMNDNTCTDDVKRLDLPEPDTTCMGFSAGNSYTYPDDFDYLNDVTWYRCPLSQKRMVISNNIPDHDVRVDNPNDMCEIPYWIILPLKPKVNSDKLEPSNLGIIAIALNGVSIFGAQEGGGTNAVEPGAGAMIQDAQYWYGHAETSHRWHYHNPQVGYETTPDEDTLIAYAMDGFPIYGPVSDSSILDECNGRTVDGSYRYHVQTLGQVDGDSDYCDGDSPAIKWNYVIGCWSGSLDYTKVQSNHGADLPDDCVEYDPRVIDDDDGDDDNNDDSDYDSIGDTNDDGDDDDTNDDDTNDDDTNDDDTNDDDTNDDDTNGDGDDDGVDGGDEEMTETTLIVLCGVLFVAMIIIIVVMTKVMLLDREPERVE